MFGNNIGSTHRPLERLAGLLTALRGKFENFGALSIEDAWDIVNTTTKQMWGRTVIEELDEDYRREGDWIEEMKELTHVEDSVKNILTDFHDLRGTLILLLKEAPSTIFVPWLTGTSGLFLPMPVMATATGEVGEDGRIVQGEYRDGGNLERRCRLE